MRQNGLYEQKRRWQRIFLFFFLLFLTGVLIPGGCASEGKKSQSGEKGGSERSVGAGASDGGFR